MKHAAKAPSAQRIVWMDFARLFSTYAVIVLHAAAMFWYHEPMESHNWQIYNIYDSVTRWCVPVFIMLSGALMLDRDIPLKRLYGKYVLRFVISFLVWSLLYALLYKKELSVTTIIGGHSHLWFVPMMTGLYMISPVLRQFSSSKKVRVYFLVLFIIFAMAKPQLVKVLGLFGDSFAQPIAVIDGAVSPLRLSFLSGYIVYYVLGYGLSRAEFKKGCRLGIYALGIASMAFTAILTSKISLRLEKPNEMLYDYMTVNVLVMSIAVFVFFKYAFAKVTMGPRAAKVLGALSKYTFGAYLVHRLILDKCHTLLNFNPRSFDPLFSIPVLSLAVLLVSMLISFLLNQIPLLKKYIV